MNLKAAETLAKSLMAQHGLMARAGEIEHPRPWKFRFDNAKRRFGACSSSRREITLSRYLVELNDEAEVTNVILHEIAHALAGARHGHDAHWKKIARSIGCTGDRCYDSNKVLAPTPPYVGTCPSSSCDFMVARHRRSRGSICPRCWKRGDQRPLRWRKVVTRQLGVLSSPR